MAESLSPLVLLFMVPVLVARLLLLNSSRADRAFNLTAMLVTIVAALRDQTVQRSLGALTHGALTPALLSRTSAATITLSSAAFLLLGLAWLNIPQSRVRTAVVWLAAVASVIGVQWVLNSSDPRPAALHHLHTGWAIIAYSRGLPVAIAGMIAHDGLGYAFCLLLLSICYREIKRRPRGLEFMACIGVMVLALGWLALTLLVTTVNLIAATGHYNAFLTQYAAAEQVGPLLIAAGIASLAAVPLIRLGVEYLREEVYSRILFYRLTKVWTALTTACPEIRHSVPELPVFSHPRYQLHLRVIEIRDAVMILSRYVTEDMITLSRQRTDAPALQQAIQLEMAGAAKLQGEPPVAGLLPPPAGSTAGLIDDAVELLELARCWSTAVLDADSGIRNSERYRVLRAPVATSEPGSLSVQ